jgi:hypothetical protein
MGWNDLLKRKRILPEQTPRLVTLEAPDLPTPEVKQPDHIGDVNKKVESVKKKRVFHHPEGWKEGTVYLRTPEDHKKYDTLKEVAELLGIKVGDMNMHAIRHYVDHVISPKLNELTTLEQRKNEIIAGLA